MQNSTPQEIVDLAAQCGMKSIDWITAHKSDPAWLGKISRDAGLDVAAFTPLDNAYINGEDNWKDEFKNSLEAAVAMGAPVMMVPPFPLKKHPEMSEGLKYWTDFYAWATPLAKEANVILTCESTGYSTSPITTADENLEVIRNVPDLRITFDNGNVETAEDAKEAYLKLKDYIVRFHLKDWKIYDSEQPGTTLKRNGKYFANAVIGQGDLDLQGFWNHVDEAGRQLYVNLETGDFSGKQDTPGVLKQVSDQLRNW
jgi:sugar phosphate isomerase/epimerase